MANKTVATLIAKAPIESPGKTAKVDMECFHCGDHCDHPINYDENIFCCHGCVAVYDILKANGLETYYELNRSPGIKTTSGSHEFDFLENEELATKLLDFDSEKVGRITLFLPDIHCSSCIWLLENLPKIHPGVSTSRVNFIKKKVSIAFHKEQTDLQKLVNFLASIGYKPRLEIPKPKSDLHSTGSSSIKIAVAGFFFGNSMLISLPEYMDDTFSMFADFKYAFGIINLMFTFPVLLYSASDYFRSAYKGLKQKHLGIDVPIALGITTLFLRTGWEIISGTGPGYADSLTGLVFFLLIGKWYQNRTYQALSFERDYQSFFPMAVQQLNGEHSRTYVALENIKPGDKLLIHNEEIIPADGIILEGKASIDYSFVTGEAQLEKVAFGDKVFAGGRQKGIPITVEVTKSVSSSYLTSLWNQLENTPKPSLKNAVDRIGGYFTLSILLIAVMAAITWSILDPAKIWNVTAAVLIIACPCALALAIPFAYGHAMRFLGRNQLFLKNSEVVEQLAHIKQIILDKTGTLTSLEIQEITFKGDGLSCHETSLIKSACENSIHPYSRLIADYLHTSKSLVTQKLKEIKGEGLTAIIEGEQVKLGAPDFLNKKKRSDPYAEIHVTINDHYKGFFSIKSHYRKGIFHLLWKLNKKFSLHLLSGDTDQEKDKLAPFFEKMYFKQKPEEKYLYTESTAKNGKTLMIGDGLNDAGALQKADVGIAVAADVHQFSPASDAIMQENSLVKLDEFLKFSRFTVRVVYAAFAISFLYNIVGLFFAVTAQLTPLVSAVLMPLSSITVVGFITAVISWRGKVINR